MEELKKLEERHWIMKMTESKGNIEIPDGHRDSHDSHRFLSNFALFLMEPCGELSFMDKCRLISDHLPKISPTLTNAELKLPSGQSGYHTDNVLSVDQVERKADVSLSPFASEDMCSIGLDAMQRANSTLEDFCRSYFMFHGMDPNKAESIFRYLPVLSFTESYIYQLDTLNERMLHAVNNRGAGHDESSNMEQNRRWATKNLKAFESNPARPLVLLLEQHGLLTERMRQELRCGEEYWTLERKLCGGLENKTKISISVTDVMRAIHLKSFDYRMLNLLLYELRGEEVNKLHMEFLSVSELLVEIADDLIL